MSEPNHRFLIRSARMDDTEGLLKLAAQARLFNLPRDESELRQKLETSAQSFAGLTTKRADSEYIFAVADPKTNNVVACSMIMGQHGTLESPHACFEIVEITKTTRVLDYSVTHHVLRLVLEPMGPTELGGLVVDTSHRGHPEKLGKQVSFARFLYIALFPQRFETRLLAELLGELSPDGSCPFWEALGKRFTHLSYWEADALSRQDKEFISSLFPAGDIHQCMLPEDAARAIGHVGEQSKGAEHLLSQIGFSYLNQVDPFDGGPHYGAKTDEVKLIKNAKSCKVSATTPKENEAQQGLVAAIDEDGSFAAVQTSFAVEGENIMLYDGVRRLLHLDKGAPVCALAY